jgi:hypothetical protein
LLLLKLCEKWESRVVCGISKRSGNPGFEGFHGAAFPQLFAPDDHFSEKFRVSIA